MGEYRNKGCADCDFKVDCICRRYPPVWIVTSNHSSLNRWEFPPAMDRCGEYRNNHGWEK